jgi:GNAT superfamily N-acetyltransferase
MASQMLARAFDDDPLTTWMFPDARTRRKRLPAFFEALLRPAFAVDEVYTTESLQGLAFWYPPGTFPYAWKHNATVGLAMVQLLRGRFVSQLGGLLYLDRHHPREPHWYLGMLGTDPQWQGKGIGSALLSAGLERCDQTGHRIYLEATKETNVPFYARNGFVVTEEMHVPKGPVMWAMWREPSPSPGSADR